MGGGAWDQRGAWCVWYQSRTLVVIVSSHSKSDLKGSTGLLFVCPTLCWAGVAGGNWGGGGVHLAIPRGIVRMVGLMASGNVGGVGGGIFARIGGNSSDVSTSALVLADTVLEGNTAGGRTAQHA
jgi:hypothetical protein